MFDTFDFMAYNWCCILGGPYYPTLPFIAHFYMIISLIYKKSIRKRNCNMAYHRQIFLIEAKNVFIVKTY